MSTFPQAGVPGMTRTPTHSGVAAGLTEGLIQGRRKYLIAAICVAVCTVMLLPLLASVLASLKSTEEAAAVPPTYFPHAFSLDSYRRLWSYQAGLPTYFTNSLGAALLTIVFCLALTVSAGYGLAKFRIPAKEVLFIVLLLGLIVPYQALLTPLFFLFVQLKLHNSLIGLAIVHTAIQLPFSIYVMRNAFEAVPRELEEAAIMDGCNSFQVLVHICLPAVVPAMITVSLFAFITSWNELLAALVIMNKDSSFTLPLILAAARQQTSIGGTDWGMLQAGITISILPCMAFYLLLQKYYMAGFLSGAVK
jgi:multiple sugar transport system permease protein